MEGTWICLSNIYMIKRWIHVTCHQCGFPMFVYISHLWRRKLIFCRWVSGLCKLMPLILRYDQFYCVQILVIKAPPLKNGLKTYFTCSYLILNLYSLDSCWLHSTLGEECLKFCFVLNTLIHSFHHKQFLKAQFRSLFLLWWIIIH